MIFARDKGRMCNNVLQYGHVYAWGREHGRQTMSMRFAYKYPYFHICDTPRHNFPTYVAAKAAAAVGLLPVVAFHEPCADTAAKERRMLRSRHVVVEGWYVRFYDLFIKYRDEIVRLFAFKPEIAERATQTFARCTAGADVAIGVHVRRGDYATWNGGRYYFSDEAYAQAIARVAALFPGRRVCAIVCGNAPQPDPAKMAKLLPGIAVSFPRGGEADDLCLLSLCHRIMGPPSTFSLVASMYRDTPLWWMRSADEQPTPDSFKKFDYLFRNIE